MKPTIFYEQLIPDIPEAALANETIAFLFLGILSVGIMGLLVTSVFGFVKTVVNRQSLVNNDLRAELVLRTHTIDELRGTISQLQSDLHQARMEINRLRAGAD